ncbi:hypothetical protein [Cribrihabitans neustonicus]|uniref:hypothetical protein n=1 Tax=Cribrihabitans neustonicus TaxID=1429085 RepID=UPI003B5AC316
MNFDAFMRFRSSPNQGFSAENSSQKRGRFRGSHQDSFRRNLSYSLPLLTGLGFVFSQPIDHGSRYLPNNYIKRLSEAGIELSFINVEGSSDNALAETINGLPNADLILRPGPWHNFSALEWATLQRGDWFNHCLLSEPIRNMPPGDAGASFSAALET